MPRLRFRRFLRGLWAAGPRDETPPDALRRARGVRQVKTPSIRSRWGSVLVTALNAHSLHRFADTRFQGATTNFYRAGTEIFTGLTGDRLTFVRMQPPLAASADYLFVAGGGTLFKVADDGTTSGWGIARPIDGFTAAVAPQKTRVIDAFNDITGTWTGISATLAGDENIFIDDTAMSMTVAASTTGRAEKTGNIDLATYADGVVSSDQDFIAVWVRVDFPDRVDAIEIAFDVGGGAGDFSQDLYTREVKVSTELIPSSQLISQIFGITDDPQVAQDELSLLTDTGLFTQKELPIIQDAIGQTTLPPTIDTWVRLRIPKATFVRTGSRTTTWADVSAVRLVVKTNANGQAIVYWDTLELAGHVGMQGRYRYHITYRNSATGSRSLPNPTFVEVDAVERQPVDLASLPASSDAQVDQIEVWRTIGNGVRFFRVGLISDAIGSYEDGTADFVGLDSTTTSFMEALELPLDNTPPESTYNDCFGPFAERMWWDRDSAVGARGRAHFSPVGRPEAVEGFVNITDDDDPTQRGVVWNNAAWIFTEAGVYQLIGRDIFVSRRVSGVPGTRQPHTVVATPFGICYQATDGIRLFTGAEGRLIGIEALGPLFRGETLENLSSFVGVVAAYCNDEYLISDGSQALAINLRDGTWRDLGVPIQAFHCEPDTTDLMASFGGNTVRFEVVDQLTDNGAAIPFEVETAGAFVSAGQQGLVQRVYIEADTNNQALRPSLILDNSSVAFAALRTTARVTTEYAVNRTGRLVGVRLDGALTDEVEVFGIEADVYVAEPERVTAG